MSINFAKIFAELFAAVPSVETIAADLKTEFNNIAHGEGGLEKIQKVLAGAATIAGHAAAAAVTLGIDPAPAQAEAKASVAEVHGEEIADVAVPESAHSSPLAETTAVEQTVTDPSPQPESAG